MKNMLVTGEAGFIRSNFVGVLPRAEPEVRAANPDALTQTGSFQNLHELPDETRQTLIEGDSWDRVLIHDLLCRHGIDTIVQFAAESHVDRSIPGPEPSIHTNVLGTLRSWRQSATCWTDSSRSARRSAS
jgi:dTDP-glucose 4,6-dehydratase